MFYEVNSKISEYQFMGYLIRATLRYLKSLSAYDNLNSPSFVTGIVFCVTWVCYVFLHMQEKYKISVDPK